MKAEPALAPFRDAAVVERLPEDESPNWRTLWCDVDVLLASAKSSSLNSTGAAT